MNAEPGSPRGCRRSPTCGRCAPRPGLQAIVVVPARDEAPRIAACLRALSTQLDMAAGSYEVILILDGCRDRTLQVVQQTTRPLQRPAFTRSPSRIPKESDAPGVSAWTSPAGASSRLGTRATG